MKVEMKINSRELEKVLHQHEIEKLRVGDFGGAEVKMEYNSGELAKVLHQHEIEKLRVGDFGGAEVKMEYNSGELAKVLHQQKIEQSRVGGFGGSDAKMFYKIGLNGLSALSNTDKMRIRVAKGIDEYKPINTTEAMQKGHDFEDWFAEECSEFLSKFIREHKVEPESGLARNFNVFAHADFYYIKGKWAIELKCVSNIDTVQDDYMVQLQWYYMLGCKRVGLIVCDSKFDDFEDGLQDPIEVEKNQNYIETLRHGIKLLDDNWNNLDLKIGDEWDESDLFPSEQKEVQLMTSYLQQIKAMEAQIEESKAKLLEMMIKSGVKSIKSESYNIAVVPPGTTSRFDKKKLLADHPEINEADYTSTSERKAYLKITLK